MLIGKYILLFSSAFFS